MATDILLLGALAFDDFSTPSRLGYGGKQQTAVHKLPGGARVVDTLGPDEKNIDWTGTFWGDTAFADAQTLQSMRIAGAVVPLLFGGMSYQVIIAEGASSFGAVPPVCDLRRFLPCREHSDGGNA